LRHIFQFVVVVADAPLWRLGVFFVSLLLTSAAAVKVVHSSPSTASRSSEFRAQPSPQRLERGRYLVEAVAHCFACHSQADFTNADGQPLAGRKGAGQIIKNEAYDGVPYPDGLVCPNITPDKETGSGTWTDAQFEHAIRHGIGRDGRELATYMPYAFFRSMTDEDVASVIVYIRSIPAIYNPLPKRSPRFPAKVDLEPAMEPALAPGATQQVQQGWYLVRIAQCNDCHTPEDPLGQGIPSLMFGGGFRLAGPWGDVVTPNITLHPSGISHYDENMFIKTIRTGYASGGVRELNPLMPYSYFRNMTDDDLKAIFAYLRTVKPVNHNVDNSEPPTLCKLCRNKHGFGDRN
jgi:mono/diheme cytochrome c family protein